MSESLMKIIDYIPFVGMAVGSNTNGSTPIVTRMVEAAIIGGVVMYGTVAVLGERIDNIVDTQNDMKQQINQIRNDFYRPNLPKQ